MRFIVRRGKKHLVMDDSLQMLMNPRKLSDEDGGYGLGDDDGFDMKAVLDGDDSASGGSGSGDGEDGEDGGSGGSGGSAADEEEVEEIGAPSKDPPSSWDIKPVQPVQPVQPSARSREDVNNAKRDLLYRFDRIEKKGVRLPRRFSMASDLAEMQAEYERLVRDREADAGIKFQKKVLVALVSGVEFLNNRFDPFDVYLDGWGETVNENLDDYDDVLEELHAKYKGKARMAPELKLLMMLIGSAFMYHLTNTMFKSAPSIGQVVKDNPELMKQFAAATANTMHKSGSDSTGMAGIFSSFFGGGQAPAAAPAQPSHAASEAPAPMRGPSSARVAEVQQFMQRQQGVPRPAVRPPLPVAGRDVPDARENPMPRRANARPTKDLRGEDFRGEDADLLEIISSASEDAISEATSGGGRRKRTLQL